MELELIVRLIECYFGLKAPKRIPAKLAHCVKVEKNTPVEQNLMIKITDAGLSIDNQRTTPACEFRKICELFKSKEEFETKAEQGRVLRIEQRRREREELMREILRIEEENRQLIVQLALVYSANVHN